MTRRPDPSDHWNGPPVEPYVPRGELWPEPEALPEGHPVREAWVARIRDWSLNDGGTPPVKDWQTERQPPDHKRPFVRREG